MTIIFVTTHLPSASVPQAGQPIALGKAQEYARHHDVHLFVVSNSWERQFSKEGEFRNFASAEVFFLDSRQRLFNSILSPWLPLRVSNRFDRMLARRLQRKVAECSPDLIHYEFTAAGAYHVPGVASTVKEHDLTFISMERRAATELNFAKRLLWKWDAARMKRWELAMLERMDSIIVLSQKDKLIVESLLPSKPVILERPSGTAYIDACQTRVAHNVLYFGALNRFENQNGLRWFIDKVWPCILRESPRSRLHVVGGGASPELLSKASGSVVFHGFVADPSAVFSSCAVAVAPILSGAGIKIKVLDYLASDLFVVATAVAAEGIESEQMVVAESEQDFAQAVLLAQSRITQ